MSSYRGDDLTPILAAAPTGPGVGYRQGVVVSWDQSTAENVIEVAGSLLSNIPILNTNEALQLVPGDVVGILTAGSSWCILGRLTIPGSAQAATALAAIGTYSATVVTSETTTSTTFTDLSTVGPTLADVPIRPSGRCLVIVSSLCDGTAEEDFATATGAAYASYEVTGATSKSPTLNNSVSASIQYQTVDSTHSELIIEVNASRVFLLEDLNAGLHTFEMKYRAINPSFTARFANRNLTVIPL